MYVVKPSADSLSLSCSHPWGITIGIRVFKMSSLETVYMGKYLLIDSLVYDSLVWKHNDEPQVHQMVPYLWFMVYMVQ